MTDKQHEANGSGTRYERKFEEALCQSVSSSSILLGGVVNPVQSLALTLLETCRCDLML